MTYDPAAEGIEGWKQWGACRDLDPNVFFPNNSDDWTLPVAICKTCPVQETCLEYALVNGIDHGIWGGETERGRRRIRKERRLRKPLGPRTRGVKIA